MARIRITKEFRFEAAHALTGYDGPCRNIHGHSYLLSVTILGKPDQENSSPKKGMVMDFGDLKAIVKTNIIDRFDHSLILSRDFPLSGIFLPAAGLDNIVLVEYQPTSENLLIDFAGMIGRLLPENIELVSLRLRETDTSYAEWFAADQKIG